MKNNIIPIVLHKVVNSKCSEIEDITFSTLKKILSKSPNSYVTIKDLNSKKISPNKFFYMVTFDDGYLSDFTIVFPLLEKLGINATFFINTDNIGKPGFLNWTMVIEMQKKGNIFGSHGHNHLKMTEISLSEAKYEFEKSKQIYESKTGQKMSLFAFPYGSYNKNLINLAIRCGYSNCFISRHGIIRANKVIIPRNSINSLMNDNYIEKILNPSMILNAKWFIEDIIKFIFKNLFGEKFYLVLRTRILSKL